MSFHLQAKILRVLEEKKLMCLGGTEYISINVRIITATHVNLEEAIKNKKFRKDLYYRINTLKLTIDPLRKRTDEILPLIRHFMQMETWTKPIAEPNRQVMNKIISYSWPGNVRELKSFVQRSLTLGNGI